MNIETLVNSNLKDEKIATEVLQAITLNPSLVKEATEAGVTALHAAARDGNFQLVLAISVQLIRNKISLDNQDVDGNTPLHYAFYNNQWRIVTFLLSQEANKNIVNKEGMPAYDEVIWKINAFDRTDSTKILAKAGESENLTDYLHDAYDAPAERVEAPEVSEREVSASAEGALHSVAGFDLSMANRRKSETETPNVTIASTTASATAAMNEVAVNKDSLEFDDLENIEFTAEDAYKVRLGMAHEAYDKRNSYAGQAQQTLSSLGLGVLSAYSALSSLATSNNPRPTPTVAASAPTRPSRAQ